MKKSYAITLFFSGILLLGGCETTTDPSKGGLFSYNPSAYEARLEQRENYLADAEAQHRSERARAASLEREVDYKSRRVSQQQQQVNQMRASIARDRQRLAELRANSNNPNYRVLEQRAARLESQINRAENTQNLAERRAYLDRLRQEHADLQHDIELMRE